jgi:hypothetical protein
MNLQQAASLIQFNGPTKYGSLFVPSMQLSRPRLGPRALVTVIAAILVSTTLGVTMAAAIGSTQPNGATVASSCNQGRVPLGAAGNFRILAATTVTNTGKTVVTGNVGLSPGSAVTGFPPGMVSGAKYVADTAAANGQAGLLIAYNNAMARSNCATLIAGNQGGKTLGPGLYDSTSSLAISSGDLTLDAHGNRGAIFIFQIASKLTITSGRQIILSGGARAENVFWVVGSSATVGTTAIVYGVILAHTSISMATGATLHGRALARIGAVTLDGNAISR